MSQRRRTARNRSPLVLLLLLTLAPCAAASDGPPAPLSREARSALADSTYGSGSFGTWFVDRFGLPAYRYDADQQVDPRARQPELAGDTRAQHQVGNDHIVAAAFNHGYTQLWSQARLSQWANRYEPESRHWAGGYGYLSVDGTVWSTLYLDRAPGAEFTREFGVGYARKRLAAAGLEVEQITYAPFGDDPLLLDDVTITNRTDAPKQVSWFEYWDVNPYDQADKVTRGVGQPVWDSATSALVVSQSGGGRVDLAPLSIFAAVLQGPLGGFETSIEAFFGSGTRATPVAVAADRASGSLAPPTPSGTPSATLLAFRAPLVLSPGQTVTLRYAYGIARGDQIPQLVTKYRARPDPLATSERAWADWVPQADFGRRWAWVARELQWDAYLLRSASVYEEVCGHHTITQGGYYQYEAGFNLGFRSWLHYLLPVVYTDPWLAHEILRYSISLQPQVAGLLPYGTGPLCSRFDALGTSNDLDFWLLLAAAEYGLGSRDTAFFAEALPFSDTGAPASVWTHVTLAHQHQESLRGPHGGYVGMTNGDWSDFSVAFLQMTESMLVTAQLAYAYPKLAELAERLGDAGFATELRVRATELRTVLRREWTGKGWYSRGYAGDRQIGTGAIFGEPQPWALLAGAARPREATRVVKNIRRFLGGVSAPPIIHGPARIGSAQSPARNDPEVTEFTAPVGVGDNISNFVGGVWFDINGWLTWALGELDGTVPHARRYAWSEYTRNTLGTHAARFPDHWAGTISVDDACWAYSSSHPENCGVGLYPQYDGQITEQPTWMVMNAIRLAGLTPTKDGYRIVPHLPLREFSLRLPRIGIASDRRRLRGYIQPEQADQIELRVKPPDRVATARLRAWVADRVVSHRMSDGFVVFTVPAAAGAPADWAITW